MIKIIEDQISKFTQEIERAVQVYNLKKKELDELSTYIQKKVGAKEAFQEVLDLNKIKEADIVE